MPSYKLVYFNARGRAEPCRWLFALAGQEYEDVRFESADWPKYKPEAPFGLAPYLEVDGVKIGQSIAMARYLGTEFGFAPESRQDQARGDMVADTIVDFLAPLFALFGEKDEEKKKTLMNTFCKEKAPALLAGFENILKQSSGDFFVGNKVTWVDVYFVTHIDGVESFIKGLGGEIDMSSYPKIKALLSRVSELPEIKAWIEKRPKTDH